MDYIEEIFNKHKSVLKFLGTTSDIMDIRDFRAAVADIEARHLKEVCKT